MKHNRSDVLISSPSKLLPLNNLTNNLESMIRYLQCLPDVFQIIQIGQLITYSVPYEYSWIRLGGTNLTSNSNAIADSEE